MQKHNSTSYISRHTVLYYSYQNGRIAIGEFSFGEVYVYDGNGNTARCTVVDASGNALAEYRYEYDSLGRLIRSTQLDGDSTLLRTEHLYDADNRLTKQSYQIGDRSFSESYAYSTADGSMQSMSTASGDSLSFSYDAIKRLSSMQAGSRYTKAYTYRTISGSQSSTQISALRYSGFSNAPTYHYTYTANGSIASQWENSNSPATFQYDTLGQLTEATLLTEDLTYFYSYDDAGNLLQVSVSGFAHGSDDYVNTYSYSNADWPDLLTAFNGQPIVYEGQTYALLTHIATGVSTVSNIRGSVRSGNPISYYNGTRWTFQWENGRWLSSAANSDTSLQFSYDLNGYRTAKTVNGVRHTYLYAGGKLLRETYSGNTLDFAYDAQGLPFSLTYNGTKYYYITNLQGDVMYLINSSGAKVASYAYDPYGKLTLSSGSMAHINPLRYRSYYYDSETGFYYLHSRYYDPAICRFLNADTYASTGQGFMGFNMFSYCSNDPIGCIDLGGFAGCPATVILCQDGYVFPGYPSADVAAAAFVRDFYAVTMSSGREVSMCIYKVERDNLTRYYCDRYQTGYGHITIDYGTTAVQHLKGGGTVSFVGFVHTHSYDELGLNNDFSDYDIGTAEKLFNKLNLDEFYMYVGTSEYLLHKYNAKTGEKTTLGKFQPKKRTTAGGRRLVLTTSSLY